MSEPTPAAALRCPDCGAPAAEDTGTCAYCGANLAVVGCPSCFAHLFAGMRYCPRCGHEVARVEEGASAFSCPDGHGALTKVRVGVMTFGECGACRGLWLDAELFGRLLDDQVTRASVLRWHAETDKSLVAAAADTVKYRSCPRCTKLMNRVNFARVSRVIVDVCKSHGTWFDRDELARVVVFVQEGGLDRTRRVEAERAAEEKRRQSDQMQFIAKLKQDAARTGPMRVDLEGDIGASDPLSRFLRHFLT